MNAAYQRGNVAGMKPDDAYRGVLLNEEESRRPLGAVDYYFRGRSEDAAAGCD
jgi:hypothetical protein